MGSSENLKKVGLAGVAATLVCLGLQECKDQKSLPGRSIESGEFDKEIRTIKRNFNERIENLTEEDNDDEYTVKVELDEEGNIPGNFDFVGAVRDCVESTGQYRCFNSYYGDSTTCYNSEAEEGQLPISISNMFWRFDDRDTGHEFIRVDGADSIPLMNATLDNNDSQDFEAQLNFACRTATEGLEKDFDKDEIINARGEDHYNYLLEESSAFTELTEGSDELFDSLNEVGFEVKDRGGNVFDIDLGNGSKGTVYAEFTNKTQMVDEEENYGVVYNVRAKEVELQDGTPLTVSRSFDTIDESLEYLIKTEEKLK